MVRFMLVKIKKSDLNKKSTIPFKFGEGHKEYIRKCRYATFNILEGAVRSGKTVDNVYAFAHELKTTPDRIHLATGSTMGNAKYASCIQGERIYRRYGKSQQIYRSRTCPR